MGGSGAEGTLSLGSIPEAGYDDYRYEVIFGAYKWDPQVEDSNTVSRHVVLMDHKMAGQLARWAEQLADETARMERTLLGKPALAREMGLPKSMVEALGQVPGYDPAGHVRLMRFDFHPTVEGWAISEVNSDVPGGLAEASVLPGIASPFFEGYGPRYHVGQNLLAAFKPKVREDAAVAFVHCTAYSDDRQVMQFLSDYFAANGLRTLFAAPDHLRWTGGGAVSGVAGQAVDVGGIVRFFPLEWLSNLPRSTDWRGYYTTGVPSCNHPVAILTQSKRLPLVWDRLGEAIPTWKQLLPETADPRALSRQADGWIWKPALGRVGEGISVPGTMHERERQAIERAARRYPTDWVAQRRFESRPLKTPEGEAYHLCIGVFTVDGTCAGFYGRISPYPRIDAKAKDIPVLVLGEDDHDKAQPRHL